MWKCTMASVARLVICGIIAVLMCTQVGRGMLSVNTACITLENVDFVRLHACNC